MKTVKKLKIKFKIKIAFYWTTMELVGDQYTLECSSMLSFQIRIYTIHILRALL